ncbi:hypothetical protein M409DRAFT_18448 [Zasmidium cellare ATCC 36951]|uniref:ER-bound oxygenase mpaB/mpaB'/Rubber oxygenase catalytic domain-containing protein n=1 Tax=Zasmidium cellare ATCC 36951 TaxID=1080233 RepID=A0A6A6CX96_ZASCE|nr:uncharacterized protein M409DRAFT_18448 [Zasmidium cellare ATCC 36951]KAF2171333.1 hypothetical protein M409DRAFT_18448 [Zasmidium cellare ATCC 36951]
MAFPLPQQLFSVAPLLFIPIFWRFSPASKSTKLWTTIYLSIAAIYIAFPEVIKPLLAAVAENPFKAAGITLSVAVPLKYIQRKLRFARINAIKWKHGFNSANPKTWQDMTIEQAKEIEQNMAEWEFPRLFQFGWLSDFFRTSTDPGVARAISSSGHFINEDKRIEHQRMQATVHLMTGLMATIDVLYLVIHFGLAPVPWINRFGYRKLEPFEVQALWVLWREVACRFGCRYVPKTLEHALEWRKNFETTMRWRDPANEVMAMAMLWQVLYPVPRFLKSFVAKVVASILDWDIVYYCRMEQLGPSPLLREVVFDVFRPYGPKEDGNVVFLHTPKYGPRALFYRFVLGCPAPGDEFGSSGVPFEKMGAPHPHPATQSTIERKVRENAAILEDAELGYRPGVGFQVNRLIPPVDGEEYGSEMNRYPPGTKLTPNNVSRFTREYERRGGSEGEQVEEVLEKGVSAQRKDFFMVGRENGEEAGVAVE